MKKKITAIGIAACMIAANISGFAAVSDYSDIPDGWAHNAVVYAVENDIFKGDNGMLFPERLLTRAELTAVINRVKGYTDTADISQYTDVSPDAWYYNDMGKAVKAGIFEGYDNKFNPEVPITREEVFAVIARAYDLTAENPSLSSFADSADVAEWATTSAAALVEAGYISGDNGNLRPKSNITRAEIAQIFYNIAQQVNVSSDSTEQPEVSYEPQVTDTPTDTSTDAPTDTPTTAPVVSSGGGSSRGHSSTSTTYSYVLMNIPYEVFYGGADVSSKISDSDKLNINYDAISSATNKVGNYGKSGGAYHSKKTAEIAEDGTVTAVGGDNGASNEGVIWPVRVAKSTDLSVLGGSVITDASEVTVATLGRGQTTSTDLKGYQTLTEAPEYSYYVLSKTPAYYMDLTIKDGKPVFKVNSGKASVQTQISPDVTYGSNWGDVQFDLSDAEGVSDKQINAVVITAKDKDNNVITAGLMHLYNVWSYSDIAWKNSQIEGLNGATITNVRYYCNNKSENSSELTYYVYDYPMNVELLPAYDGEVTAEFADNEIILNNLPEDIANLKAQVYHTTGGRPPVYTYLTPLEVDPADDDIDPITVDVTDGKITIVSGSVTNKAGITELYGNPKGGTTYTIALSSDNYAPLTVQVEYAASDSYVLMNIPYEAFYGAENISSKVSDNSKLNMNYDAISSATNKVGNYGKSGGAYHSKKTAEFAEDGTVTAVGGDNGASNEGVIWPVKVGKDVDLAALGGSVITDDSEVTVATLGRGQTSSTDLNGYQTLTEAPEYSYYVLSEKPAYYMDLTVENGKPVFTANSQEATTKTEITPAVTYGSNWGDVQFDLSDAEDVSDKQINAVVITAKDNDNNIITAGLIHLYNVWSYSDIAWKNSQIEGLNGATITNVRYYCNNKSENSSELTYYVYDYPMNVELLPAYDGEVTAEFADNEIILNNLPEDIANLKAQVYHTTGGRPPVYTYLTPLEVDPADDDIDPITVDVTDGKITIVSGSVTNKAGDTETYGNPIDGITYIIALSSDNYAPLTVQVEYAEE